jgi:hypothetical protein
MSDDQSLLLEAAKRIVEARTDKDHEIVGVDPPGENSYWQFYVEKKGVDARRRKPTVVLVTEEDLQEAARDQLSIEQIQGKKPRPAAVSEAVKREYSDGYDDLFEPRD